MKIHLLPLLLLACMISCNNDNTSGNAGGSDGSEQKAPDIQEEPVTYQSDSITMNGYVAYDANREGKLPVVLVVHEWWGLNDYTRNRARQLAQMGYMAMAVDMFGNGKQAADPGEAQALAGPFYKNPQLARTRLDAAFAKIRENNRADAGRAAAIGYCYGGYAVLNAAKLGSDLDGVVVFHGNLGGAPATKDMKTKVLVCHGGADPFVPQEEVVAFRKSMDSVGADYDFKVYQNATHAFTNPAATETGKKFELPISYNAAADSASWNHMKAFLRNVLK